MSTCNVLFFAASPNGVTPLALDEECREIDQKIRAAEYREELQLITKWAVRPDDLLQYLNQYRPHIVHFSGHGSGSEEIILLDSKRRPKAVSKAALKQLFSALKDNIRVVVLNACFSRPQAEAIAEIIDCAIGMRKAISDEAAIAFAATFYRALGFGRSVKEAFDQGRTALMLDGLPEEETPELLVRAGVDPANIILVESRRCLTSIEFTLDRPISDFDEAKFKIALKLATGVDASTIRIASIRSGSTKVQIDGEQQSLTTIIQKIRASKQIAQQLALQTGMRKMAWEVDGTYYEFSVEAPNKLSSSSADMPLQRIQATSRRQIFVSYSHEDTKWREDLEKHLKPYLRGSILSWSDQQITPGSEWFKEIQDALANSKVAVLLVSPDFLASDFIHEHELGPFLQEAKQGGVKILWVPLRDCAYKKTALKDYQAVLDPGTPLAKMIEADRDSAWVRICEEIEKAVDPP